MAKTGLYMPWYVGGSTLVIVGAALMHTTDVGSAAADVFGYPIIIGAGIGCFCQASFAIAQAKVAPTDIPIAVAFIGCAHITGICVCFAIAYGVFLNTATNQIATILPNSATSEIQQSIIGVGSSIFSTLDQVQELQVLEAVNSSIRNVWIQVLAAGALSFVMALVMKYERVLIKR